MVTTLATGNLYAFGGIAVDNTDVFFMESGGEGNLFKVSKDGGTVINLASLIYITRNRVVVDSTYAYFTETGSVGGGAVKKVPKAGGDVITLASNLNDPKAIALDSSSVYFVECGTLTPCGGLALGSVMRVSKDGGVVTTLANSLGVRYYNIGVAVDDTAVYFVDPGDGGLTGTINKVWK